MLPGCTAGEPPLSTLFFTVQTSATLTFPSPLASALFAFADLPVKYSTIALASLASTFPSLLMSPPAIAATVQERLIKSFCGTLTI